MRFLTLSSSLPLLVRKDDCLEGVVENGVNGWMYSSEEEFDSFLEEYLSLPDTSLFRKNAEKTSYEFSFRHFAERIEKLYIEEIGERKKNEA